MRRFRFFSLIAIVAAFSTVFAAWQYTNYANEYKSEAANLAVTIDDSSLEAIPALTLAVANANDVEVVYVQSSEQAGVAVANVNNDVVINVTENEDGTIEQYDFYYAVYGGGSSADGSFQQLGSLKELSVYEANDVVDYTKLTALEVDAEGNARISKEIIAGLLEHQFATEGVDIDNFEAALEAFKAKVENGSVFVKVYAKKDGFTAIFCTECGVEGHTADDHCEWCDTVNCTDVHCPTCGSTEHVQHPAPDVDGEHDVEIKPGDGEGDNPTIGK